MTENTVEGAAGQRKKRKKPRPWEVIIALARWYVLHCQGSLSHDEIDEKRRCERVARPNRSYLERNIEYLLWAVRVMPIPQDHLVEVHDALKSASKVFRREEVARMNEISDACSETLEFLWRRKQAKKPSRRGVEDDSSGEPDNEGEA